MLSEEFMNGLTAGLVFASDIFEQHCKALYHRRILRKCDVEFVCDVLEACLRHREKLAEVGPKGMRLVIKSDGSIDLKEK